MEIWAHCDGCRRWFYCPEWFDQAKPQPVCPLCSREPTAIENRAARTEEAPAVAALVPSAAPDVG